MKTKLKFSTTFLAITLFINSLSITASENIEFTNVDPDKDKVLIYVLKNILTRGHFVVKDMNDDFSEHVFNSFIDGLDSSKRYFTQEDIKEFSQYKYQIDNQLLEDDLTFYKLVYGRFLDKIKNAKSYYGDLLAQPFNFKKNETIDLDYKKVPFAKNDNELIDYWRKQLKLQTLSRIEEQIDLQEDKLKKDKKYKVKSFATLEKEARAEVLKNMEELYIRIEELEHDDWFSTFLNSVVGAFDPHTTYMDPSIKERFDQTISGKLEGIGARLQKKGAYTHVFELVAGGPAWKQGELEPGDIILEVAQGDLEPLNIVSMRLDDAIKFIKGKKGTEVRLTVKKKIDGSTKIISIIRDVVQLDETFVKSSIVEKNGKKYAIIDLPSFYIDFSDNNYRDSAKDMEKEIERLKAEGVNGLIVDLRNNGGGSLKTAIEISGLFIDKGPVVQVKYRGEKPIVKEDIDPSVQWDGAVVVLVNEFSASASEIFAAAMQDYKRGVILGGNQTYGKGTVQNLQELSQKLGAIKATIQKFYRINGGSTQNKGVIPDIAYPTAIEASETGESVEDNALPWDSIPPAKYDVLQGNDKLIATLTAQHQQRIEKDMEFNFIAQDIAKYKAEKDDNTLSLNEKVRVAESDKADKIRLERINLRQKSDKQEAYKSLDDVPKDYESPDVYLDESVAIMVDMLKLESTD